MRAHLVIRLLRTVSWPYLRGHAVRAFLTVAGVSVGVAAVVGIANVSVSVLASFRHMIDVLAGAAEIEVTNSGAGVDETLLEEVKTVPGVRDAGGLVEAFLPLADDPGEQVFVVGTDFLNSEVWEIQFPRTAVHIEDPAVFLAALDSVAVPRPFLERRGLAIDGEMALLTPAGRSVLRIRGVLDAQGPAQLFGGALALMDLPAAQRLLEKQGRLDRIAVRVDAGTAPAEVRERIARVVGDRGRVAAAEARGEQAENLLFSLRAILLIMSLGAVIVGAFIVYQTVGISIYERRRSLAILNAVGVPRPALLRLCVLETAMLATLGAAIGLLEGQILARLAAGVVGGVASQVWVRIGATEHAQSITGIAVGIAVAMGAALGAAYVAARATFAGPTIESLRPSGGEPRLALLGWRRATLSLLLLAGVWLAVLAPPMRSVAAIAGLVIFTHTLGYAGAAILSPSVVSGAGLAARRAVRRWNGFSLRLAAENLSRSAVRSGATVATVAAAVGIATVVATLATTFERSWMNWIQEYFAADLYVGRGSRAQLVAGSPMSRGLAADLAAVPGVAEVEPYRTLPLTFRGYPVFLQGMAIDQRQRRGGLDMVEGTLEAAADRLRAGTGVLVSDNLAYRFGVHRGDEVELATPQGPRRFRVEGTFVDYFGSLDLGSIVVDIGYLETYWGDTAANLFRVWLEPPASAIAVRGEILARLGRSQGLYVLTAGDFRRTIHEVIQNFFTAVWGLQVVAALVGVIGVINAQAAAVVDRRREITVLQAIGVRESALRRMVVLESASIGLVGGVVGGALGLMLGAQIVLVSLRLVTGWQMKLVLPGTELVSGLVLVGIIAALAGYVPAHLATRQGPTPVVSD